MRSSNLVRGVLASLLTGGMMLTIGCGDLVRQSVRDGLFTWVSGSVQGAFDATVFSDMITNFFADVYTGSGRITG